MGKNSSGQIAEEAVCKYLRKAGHEVLAKNYRTKFGEIDIVYREKNSRVLVFAEVKYRKSDSFGSPYEYVDRRKITKIKRAINIYLYENNISSNSPMRLDVFSILGEGRVKHFRAVDTDW